MKILGVQANYIIIKDKKDLVKLEEIKGENNEILYFLYSPLQSYLCFKDTENFPIYLKRINLNEKTYFPTSKEEIANFIKEQAIFHMRCMEAEKIEMYEWNSLFYDLKGECAI